MSGKQSKKHRQQFKREFRTEAVSEAKKMIAKQSEEMDDHIEKLNDRVFKKCPKLVPMWLWRFGIARFCHLRELDLNGIGNV